MLDIKAEFLKMYGKTLYSFIKVSEGWGNTAVSKSFPVHQLWYYINHSDHRDSSFDLNVLGICVRTSRFTVYQFGFMRLIALIPPRWSVWSLWSLSPCAGRHVWWLPQNPAGAVWRRVKETSEHLALSSLCRPRYELFFFFFPRWWLPCSYLFLLPWLSHFTDWPQCLVLLFCVVIPIKPKSSDLLHKSLFLLLILH